VERWNAAGDGSEVKEKEVEVELQRQCWVAKVSKQTKTIK
jgi:hypothetical protein